MDPVTLACKHCGAPLPAPARSAVITCEHCGTKLQLDVADNEPSVVEREPDVIIVKEKGHRWGLAHVGNLAPLVACMPFVVFIVLILAVFAFFVLLICAGVLFQPVEEPIRGGLMSVVWGGGHGAGDWA